MEKKTILVHSPGLRDLRGGSIMAVTAVGGNNFNAPRAKEATPVARQTPEGTTNTKENNPNNSQKTTKNIAPTNGQNNGFGAPSKGANIDFRA